MAYALAFYQDQLLNGAPSAPLAPASRMLYVRHGRVTVNGRAMGEDTACFAGEETTIVGAAEWSCVWRWELAEASAPERLLSGAEIHSVQRMVREIASLDIAAGSRWLFRLDRIKMAAGRVTDPHVHPGPGIRCLLEGAFHAEQASEPVPPRLPGDPWWEVGPDEVVAYAAPTMRTRFLRGMILPATFADGTETAKWLDTKAPPPSDNWTLYVDRAITV